MPTQYDGVKVLLERAYPQYNFEIYVITTKRDRTRHVALGQIKDKGTSVKRVEQQLLEHMIDPAIRGMKDIPSMLDECLCFTETFLQGDACDVLILCNAVSLKSLSLRACTATRNKRRRFRLLRQREDLKIVDIHGNIETRLKKLEDRQLDGVVLIAVEPERLQLTQCIT